MYCIYFRFFLNLNIKYIYLLYKYKHVNIFKIYTVCVLYMHNKYTQNTHILQKKTFILYAINRLTALILLLFLLC